MWKDLSLVAHLTVCSILELRYFGECSPTITSGIFSGDPEDHAKDLEKFKAHLRTITKLWNKQYENHGNTWSNKSVERTGLIVAYVASSQPVAYGYLNDLGFTSSGFVPKLKHPESEVAVLFMKSVDFLSSIGYDLEKEEPKRYERLYKKGSA